MKIEIITKEFPGGWHPQQLPEFLGGNEETLTLFPRALAKAGHQVTVFTDLLDDAPYHDGIADLNYITSLWLPRRQFKLDEHKEVLITFKDRSPIFRGVTADRIIHWSQDIESQWTTGTLARIDAMVLLSTYHAERMPWVPEGKLIVSPLGMDFPEEMGVQKDPDLMVYGSSPDRGLVTLLNDWKTIKDHHPNLKLVVTYSWSNLAKWGGQQFIVELEEKMRQPDIQRAELNREQMIALIQAATYYVFPINRMDSDLCGFGLQKAIHSKCKPVLNYCYQTGFRDVTEEFVPYRLFMRGDETMVKNKGFRSPARDWDDLVENDWEPLFQGGAA